MITISKKVLRFGNSKALIIPEIVCKQLDLKAGSYVWLYFDDTRFTVEKQKIGGLENGKTV